VQLAAANVEAAAINAQQELLEQVGAEPMGGGGGFEGRVCAPCPHILLNMPEVNLCLCPCLCVYVPTAACGELHARHRQVCGWSGAVRGAVGDHRAVH
jgi:hypothetical protein